MLFRPHNPSLTVRNSINWWWGTFEALRCHFCVQFNGKLLKSCKVNCLVLDGLGTWSYWTCTHVIIRVWLCLFFLTTKCLVRDENGHKGNGNYNRIIREWSCTKKKSLITKKGMSRRRSKNVKVSEVFAPIFMIIIIANSHPFP